MVPLEEGSGYNLNVWSSLVSANYWTLRRHPLKECRNMKMSLYCKMAPEENHFWHYRLLTTDVTKMYLLFEQKDEACMPSRQKHFTSFIAGSSISDIRTLIASIPTELERLALFWPETWELLFWGVWLMQTFPVPRRESWEAVCCDVSQVCLARTTWCLFSKLRFMGVPPHLLLQLPEMETEVRGLSFCEQSPPFS